MYYVSLCYRDGKGVGKNPTASMKFLFEAAKRNYGTAQYEFAMALEKGDIIERNDSLAHQWLEKAVANNEPRALLEMSHRYRDGKNVEQDSQKSEKLLKQAAELQEPTALFEYAELLITNGRNGFRYMEAAADLGNEKAMIYMFEYLDGEKRYKEAYRFAKALSDAGNHEGTRRVADYYYEGKGVSRDKSLAKDLYYEAARAGNKEAKEKLRGL
jgi:TPR repeat protein